MRVLMATAGFLPEIGGVEGIERLSQLLTRLGFRVTIHPVGRNVGASPDDNPILRT